MNLSKARYSSTTDPEVEITAAGNVRVGDEYDRNDFLHSFREGGNIESEKYLRGSES